MIDEIRKKVFEKLYTSNLERMTGINQAAELLIPLIYHATKQRDSYSGTLKFTDRDNAELLLILDQPNDRLRS